ncbi:MAG: hypothetical protein COA36_02255 [Desulfotalea sp.]|nr:MAG: hypothetical protein COA36_02255 [Desulfotalea sp.]
MGCFVANVIGNIVKYRPVAPAIKARIRARALGAQIRLLVGVLAVVFVLLLSGCALQRYSPDPDLLVVKPNYPKLQQIRIERWGDVAFNGLLVIRAGDNGFYYALVDPMGVTLLQAWSDAGGDHNAVLPRGPLGKKGLAPFLSEALARIYLLEPDKLPCSRQGWSSVCVKDGGKTLRVKTGYKAGIAYWKVEEQLDPGSKSATATGAYIRYNQPWLGVDIFLQQLPKKE